MPIRSRPVPGCSSYHSVFLVLVLGCEDAIHLELTAQLSYAGPVVGHVEICVTVAAARCRVCVLAGIFRYPRAVPDFLKERLEEWDASGNYNDATLDAFQRVSWTLMSNTDPTRSAWSITLT